LIVYIIDFGSAIETIDTTILEAIEKLQKHRRTIFIAASGAVSLYGTPILSFRQLKVVSFVNVERSRETSELH